MWWNEELPDDVKAAVTRAGVNLHGGVIHISSDLDEDAAFGKRWLVMDRSKILVLTPDGKIVQELATPDVKRLDACNYVGSGLLRAETDAGMVALVRYSAGKGRAFGLIARGFEPFKKDGVVQVSSEHAPKKCPHCGRHLDTGESVCPLCVSKSKVVWRLWGYASAYKKRLVVVALILIFTAASSVLPYKVQQLMIDRVFSETAPGAPSLLLLLVFTMAVLMLVNAFTGAMLQLQMVYIGQNIVYRVRSEIFRHVMDMGLPFFDRYRAGEMMSRIDGDSNRLDDLVSEVAQFIFRDGVMVLWILTTMLAINWRLALIALVPAPIIMFATRRLFQLVRFMWHRMRQAHARMSSTLNTTLTGMRVVKAFGQEDAESGRFDNKSRDLRDVALYMRRMFAIVFPAMTITMQVGGLLVWYFGGRMLLNSLNSLAPAGKEMTLGYLMYYIGLLNLFYGPFGRLMQMSRWAAEGLAASQRIFDVLDTDPDPAQEDASEPAPALKGGIRFDNVTFGYEPLKPVLKEVSLEIKPGEMIGFVGHSGAGKTTMTNLVMRFYVADEGAIFVDDVDIKNVLTQDLRSQMAVVPQEPYLFAGSVAENISYGRKEYSGGEILAATMAANAHDFVMKMPDAYDSSVGAQGQRMSQGERQRLTIARAIICDPRILILDEATSSVDTDAETQIQQALGRLVRGRTTIAIAHRLSTLKNAHRLVVLKDGKIEEMGTHEELIRKGGEYKRLVELQSELSRITAVGG